MVEWGPGQAHNEDSKQERLSGPVQRYLDTSKKMGDPDITEEEYHTLSGQLRQFYEEILASPQLHRELREYRERQRQKEEGV